MGEGNGEGDIGSSQNSCLAVSQSESDCVSMEVDMPVDFQASSTMMSGLMHRQGRCIGIESPSIEPWLWDQGVGDWTLAAAL